MHYGQGVASPCKAWLSLHFSACTTLLLQAAGPLIGDVLDRSAAWICPVASCLLKLPAVLAVVGAALLTLASAL